MGLFNDIWSTLSSIKCTIYGDNRDEVIYYHDQTWMLYVDLTNMIMTCNEVDFLDVMLIDYNCISEYDMLRIIRELVIRKLNIVVPTDTLFTIHLSNSQFIDVKFRSAL